MCKHMSADAPALPHLKFWAKWYYLHWKTLESTVRHMQLKHFPLGKRAET